MGRVRLTPALFGIIADRFKVLGEPARLAILDAMRGRERTVTELSDDTGLAQANLSKHLRLLLSHGFVKKRKNSLFSHYSVTDRDVYTLCDVMCRRLDNETRVRRKLTARV